MLSGLQLMRLSFLRLRVVSSEIILVLKRCITDIMVLLTARKEKLSVGKVW